MTFPRTIPGAYGIDVAGDGRVWFAEREANKIGRLDPATGKIDEFTTPGSTFRAGWERIGRAISGSASMRPSKLVKVDQKTGKMTFYEPPTKNSGTYHVVPDARTKMIWVTEQTADKIARFDPRTETWTEFSLPIIESDARRIETRSDQPEPHLVVGRYLDPSRLHRGAPIGSDYARGGGQANAKPPPCFYPAGGQTEENAT